MNDEQEEDVGKGRREKEKERENERERGIMRPEGRGGNTGQKEKVT